MLYGAAGERAALDGLEMVVDRRRDRQTDRGVEVNRDGQAHRRTIP